MINEQEACPIKMIEIYGGRDELWKGWYNLIINDVESQPIAGPLHPELSEPFLKLIKEWGEIPSHDIQELEQVKQERDELVAYIERLEDLLGEVASDPEVGEYFHRVKEVLGDE